MLGYDVMSRCGGVMSLAGRPWTRWPALLPYETNHRRAHCEFLRSGFVSQMPQKSLGQCWSVGVMAKYDDHVDVLSWCRPLDAASFLFQGSRCSLSRDGEMPSWMFLMHVG